MEAVAKGVLVVLKTCQQEWAKAELETKGGQNIGERLEALAPPINHWISQKKDWLGNPTFSPEDSTLIQKLKASVETLHSWLKAFNEEKKKSGGKIARGLKMMKNVGKKFSGQQTTYDELLKMVKELDDNIKDMQVVVTAELHAGIENVVDDQKTMMKMIDELLRNQRNQAQTPPGAQVCSVGSQFLFMEKSANTSICSQWVRVSLYYWVWLGSYDHFVFTPLVCVGFSLVVT